MIAVATNRNTNNKQITNSDRASKRNIKTETKKTVASIVAWLTDAIFTCLREEFKENWHIHPEHSSTIFIKLGEEGHPNLKLVGILNPTLIPKRI